MKHSLVNDHQINFRKPIAIIGLLYFALIVFLQFYFFELRLLVDGSVSLFMISTTKTLDIAEDRFLIGVTQLLPLLGAHLGFSLKTLAISYMVNDVLLYIVAFLLLLIPLKDPLSALILILGYIATGKYHFFILTYSYPMAWPLMLITLSVMRHYSWGISKWGFIPLWVAIHYMVFGHPLIVVTFGMLWAYEFSQMHTRKDRLRWLIPMAIMVLLFIAKWQEPDPYDVGQLNAASNSHWSDLSLVHIKHQLYLPILYPTFFIMLGGSFVIIKRWFKEKKHLQILVPIGALVLLAGVYILFSIPLKYTLGHWVSKALAPFTLVMLYIMADLVRRTAKLSKLNVRTIVYSAMILILWELGITVFFVSNTFEQRRIAVHELIEQIPDDNRSKFVVPEELVDDGSFYRLITASEVAVISELFYDLEYTPNLIVKTEKREPVLDTLSKELIYINTNTSMPAGKYKPYFNFKPGLFKEIPFDDNSTDR